MINGAASPRFILGPCGKADEGDVEAQAHVRLEETAPSLTANVQFQVFNANAAQTVT